jgi:hypothetical protein
MTASASCHLMRFLRKAEGAVLASIHRSRASERNVLVRVSETTATSVANSHFSVHFNDGYLVDKLHGIAAMLTEFVLHRESVSYDNVMYNVVRKTRWNVSLEKSSIVHVNLTLDSSPV